MCITYKKTGCAFGTNGPTKTATWVTSMVTNGCVATGVHAPSQRMLHIPYIGNKSAGPYGVETNEKGVEPGDIVQLGNKNGYYHSPVVVDVAGNNILVAAHSYDAYMRPLDSYVYEQARFIHIQGARKW